MPMVMLPRTWPGTFGRVVRDKDKKPVEPPRVLSFPPGESVEVDEADMPQIAKDIEAGILRVNPLVKTASVAVEQEPEEPDATHLPGRHRGRRG